MFRNILVILKDIKLITNIFFNRHFIKFVVFSVDRFFLFLFIQVSKQQ